MLPPPEIETDEGLEAFNNQLLERCMVDLRREHYVKKEMICDLFAEEQKAFDKFIWEYADNKATVGRWERMEDVPTTAAIFDKISKDMKNSTSTLSAVRLFIAFYKLSVL
jgi:hypothetical protein